MSTQDPAPKLIDGIFEVVKGRFLYHSYDKEGKGLVSGLTEESVIRMTHFYLKGLQDGWTAPEKTFAGTVGGKL